MVGGARPIVLVADDDASLRLLCRVNLDLDGYDVREAASAAEVEEILAAEPVSLVLLDIHLGKDDGVAVARTIRDRHPDVAIVFFTGSATPPSGADAGDGRLSKPFSLEELAALARRLARERALLRT